MIKVTFGEEPLPFSRKEAAVQHPTLPVKLTDKGKAYDLEGDPLTIYTVLDRTHVKFKIPNPNLDLPTKSKKKKPRKEFITTTRALTTLMWETFKTNQMIPPGRIIAHRDGNPRNNSIINLGLVPALKFYNPLLSDDQISEKVSLSKHWDISLYEKSKIFNIPQPHLLMKFLEAWEEEQANKKNKKNFILRKKTNKENKTVEQSLEAVISNLYEEEKTWIK